MGITRHPLSGPHPKWSRVPTDRAAMERLRSSFQVLAAGGPRFAAIFYAKLFARHPGVRALFPSDMRAQEQKLTDTLGVVIEHIESPEVIRTKLLEMGERHAGYEAKPEHYGLVCEVLIEAMGEAAAPGAWGPTVAAEWRQALELVSAIMLEGARRAGAVAGGSHATDHGRTRVDRTR